MRGFISRIKAIHVFVFTHLISSQFKDFLWAIKGGTDHKNKAMNLTDPMKLTELLS